MKKLLILIIILAGCQNTPKIVTQNNSKSDPALAIDTTKSNIKDTASSDPAKRIPIVIKQALSHADTVTVLSLGGNLGDSLPVKHLPPQIAMFRHLKELDMGCIENLVDLPTEIGNLKSLEKLIIDNGNGCAMNIDIPSSIGNLSNLKELILWGALDAEIFNHFNAGRDTLYPDDPRLHYHELPSTLANLQNLEVLNLGRNGMKAIPAAVYTLHKLKILKLDYNEIHVIDSSISNLTNLEELSVCSNSYIKLPQSLRMFKKLKVFIGNNSLKLADQKKLQERFPNITFSFENEYDDGVANEEAPN